MAITPCGHRVLVRPDEVSETQGGVIVVPHYVREKQQYAQTFGTLVAVGPQAWKAHDPSGHGNGEPWAKVGDRVSFAKYGGFIIEDPTTKEQFRLLNDEDIIAVVDGGKYEIREETG